MAKEKDFEEIDQGCYECGELHYAPSKVDGLCANCCLIGTFDIGMEERDYDIGIS